MPQLDLRDVFAPKRPESVAKGDEEPHAAPENVRTETTAAHDNKRCREMAENANKEPHADEEASLDGSEIESLHLNRAADGKLTCSMAKLLKRPGGASVLENARWEDGSCTPYAFVADVLADVSATGSRLECTALLARMFLSVLRKSPKDLLACVYITVNRQAPAHEGLELGVGDAVLVKVVSEVCGLTEKRVKEKYQTTGDLAEVAQESKQRQCTLLKAKPLSVNDVFTSFVSIAKMNGKDVVRRRVDVIKGLLRNANGPEINFIVRALQGKMRIGVAEPSALQALAAAFVLDRHGDLSQLTLESLQQCLDSAGERLANIYHEVPSLDLIVPVLIEHRLPILETGSAVARKFSSQLGIRPGLPVRPMLAHPTTGISAILNRFQGKKFTCEYKYDGERAQIHYADGKFEIFSRNSERQTTKFPDIIQFMPSTFDPTAVTSFIVDSEAVAVDPATGQLQAFQVLQHRGRKNIELSEIKVPVCVFVFDLLYLNGTSILNKPLSERRTILRTTFKSNSGLRFAQNLDTSDVDEVQSFLNQSISDGCEGLMVKTLFEDAFYTPAKRSYCWLKLKKDYIEGFGDTLDLVPIGAYYGKGKRTGVFGGFLLACYDPETEEYQSICKIGTGFTDAILESLTAQLTPAAQTVPSSLYRFHESHRPDVWFADSFVWEVKAADLSVSPTHYAAMGRVAEDRGIALRFPRFIRVREDKGPLDATTAEQVAEMYRSQSLAQKPAADGICD